MPRAATGRTVVVSNRTPDVAINQNSRLQQNSVTEDLLVDPQVARLGCLLAAIVISRSRCLGLIRVAADRSSGSRLDRRGRNLCCSTRRWCRCWSRAVAETASRSASLGRSIPHGCTRRRGTANHVAGRLRRGILIQRARKNNTRTASHDHHKQTLQASHRSTPPFCLRPLPATTVGRTTARPRPLRRSPREPSPRGNSLSTFSKIEQPWAAPLTCEIACFRSSGKLPLSTALSLRPKCRKGQCEPILTNNPCCWRRRPRAARDSLMRRSACVAGSRDFPSEAKSTAAA
jgi:hypothetical protein